MVNRTPPNTAAVMGTLDELAAAARTRDARRYRAAYNHAQAQGLSEEQIRDAYDWGRDGSTRRFDWRGE